MQVISSPFLTTFTTEDGLAHNSVQSVFQDREGNLWFGTWGGGVSRYDGRTFTTFNWDGGLAHNQVVSTFQDRRGHLWFGTWGGGVSRYDPSAGPGPAAWTTFTSKDGLAYGMVWPIFQDRKGHLWFGTWGGGVSRYDPSAGPGPAAWTTYTTEGGLGDNRVSSIVQDGEGVLWFGTGAGVSRYDGRTFQTMLQEDGLASDGVGPILQDDEGAFWFGTPVGVTRYRPPAPSPPPVFLDAVVADRRHEGAAELAIPSTTRMVAFEFHGASFITRPEGMVYRYRLAGYDEDWKTTRARRVEYQDLPRGAYTFEVEAVDRDLTYSTAPAAAALRVNLPYEWIGGMAALGIAILLIAYQGVRIVQRGRRLSSANRELREKAGELENTNRALSDANKDLFGLTQALRRERAVERIRGQIQAMERASDFEGALSILAEDLRAVGLRFDTCGIDVLGEPVDEPTMAYFEENGFRYTTYTIDPEGRVMRESYHQSAPFPPVNREMIERFLAGEPWQARIGGGDIIAEVPISKYGRLRLTASDRPEFTGEEIDMLRDFADAIALGYARFLDFQRLEEANREIREAAERKSQFLSNMSHELRTPMTAIKGFTNLVIRRSGENLPERQRDNLARVIQSSDHLLNLINDILDLSRIEAGRLDIAPAPFDVKGLIASSCSIVGPLVKPGVAFDDEAPDDIGEANTDEARLRQILINLLSNALKFTDSGKVAVRAEKEGGFLTISVSDTGAGIPEEAREAIFDEFRQVEGSDPQHKGTGLGLSITKRLTELLGGTISVESEVGVGSTFAVRIPAVYKNA